MPQETSTQVQRQLDGDWVSRSDAAKLAGCSVDTIIRDIREHDLPTQPGTRGQVMVCLRDLVSSGRIAAHQLSPGTTGAEAAELLRTREEVVTLKVELAETVARLACAEQHTASLGSQLASKDEQLATLGRAHAALASCLGAGGAP